MKQGGGKGGPISQSLSRNRFEEPESQGQGWEKLKGRWIPTDGAGRSYHSVVIINVDNPAKVLVGL